MYIIEELKECMKEVGEGTQYHGYFYSIGDVLTISVSGMMCGIEKAKYIWEWANEEPVRQFLSKEFGIEKMPCYAQYMNILGIVDAEKFNVCFVKWVQGILGKSIEGKTVAIDGKSVCGAGKVSKSGDVLHIASAVISETGLVLGSRDCGTKTGEITAFRELLEMLDVKGTMVVADALHCNKKSADCVIEAGADYLFVVKDNQANLKENIELYFAQPPCKPDMHITAEKNGGRIERRSAYVSHDVEHIRGDWKSIMCIGAIHRHIEKGGNRTSEWHYYISSAPLSANDLLTHARAEWQVESMHWLLDVHFKEDKTGIWNMNAQKIMNILRKIVLNLLREYKSKTGSKFALSAILRKNLFNVDNLAAFLAALKPLIEIQN